MKNKTNHEWAEFLRERADLRDKHGAIEDRELTMAYRAGADALDDMEKFKRLNPWPELQLAFEQIEAERRKQNSQWGGAKHDDEHNSHDWIAYIIRFLGRCADYPFDEMKYHDNMKKAAALCVAALEWINRNHGGLQ